MYPDSILQWLGYLGLVFGVLAVVVLIALTVHSWAKKPRSGPSPENPDDEIPDRIEELPE